MGTAHTSKFIWLGVSGLLLSSLASAEGNGVPFEKEITLPNPCAVFNEPTQDPNITRIAYGENIDFALKGSSRAITDVDSRGRVHLKFLITTHGDGVGQDSGIKYQLHSKALVKSNTAGYAPSGLDPRDAGFVYNGTVNLDARIISQDNDASTGGIAQTGQDNAQLRFGVNLRYANGEISHAPSNFTLKCVPSPWKNMMNSPWAGTTKPVRRGFGDPWNKYAWSMKTFKGGMVVGTKSAFYDIQAYLNPTGQVKNCLESDPPIYQVTDIHAPLACMELFGAPNSGTSPASADTRFGEIWRFGYSSGTWTRVRDDKVSQGFRIMETHNNKLYAGSDLGAFITGVDLYTGIPGAWNFPGSQMLVSTDGKSFHTIESCVTEGPCNSATGLSNPYGLIGTPPSFTGAVNTSIRALASYKGKLYVGTFNTMGGELWSYDDVADHWALVHKFYVPAQKPAIAELRVFNNKLYIGLGGPAGGNYLYRYDGSSVQLVPGQPSLPATNMGTLKLFTSKGTNGLLYIGNVDLTGGFFLQSYDGSAFRTLSSNGLFNSENAYAWSMAEINGRVFVGTFNQDFLAELPRGSAELWYSDDSIVWQQMALPLEWGLWNYGIRTMEVGNNRLFLGSASNMVAPNDFPASAPHALRRLLTPGAEVWTISTSVVAPSN